MEIKPVFHNDTFQTNFSRRVKTSFDNVPERIQELKDMVEDVILDYKFNKDPNKTYKLAVELDSQMNKFFDCLNDYELDENDIQTLTEICRKINENPFLEEIRERGSNSIANEDAQRTGRHNVKSNALPEEIEQKQSIAFFTSNPDFLLDHVNNAENKKLEDNKPFAFFTNNPDFMLDHVNNATEIKQPENKPIAFFTSNPEFMLDHVNVVNIATDNKNSEENKPLAFFTNNPDFMLSHVNGAVENKKLEEEKINILYSKDKTEKIKEQFLQLINKMQEEYEEHRIEDAYEYKNKAIEFAQANRTEPELQEFCDAQLEKNKKEMAELDTWYQHIQKVVQELEDDQGYTVEKGKKAYKLSYKLRPDGKVAMKMEGTLEMPLFNILSLMYEADGFNHWVPFCAEARLIKPLHRAAHTYWLRYGLPIITDRECYCYGIGVDRLHRNGSVLAISRKIHDNPAFCELYGIEIPAKSKYVKMDIDVGMEIIPISRQKIQLKVVTTVDPNVKNTPPSILAWISRKASQHLFDKLIKKAQNLKGTLWEKRIQEKKEFYGWLEAKVNAFLDEHKLD